MGNGSRHGKRTWMMVWSRTHKARRTIRGRSETELSKDRSWACQSELTRQQYPLFCLSLGISSSFPLIISNQLDAQICYINPAVFLFFSVVSKPLCKAKLTLTLHSTIPFKAHILPISLRHSQRLPGKYLLIRVLLSFILCLYAFLQIHRDVHASKHAYIHTYIHTYFTLLEPTKWNLGLSPDILVPPSPGLNKPHLQPPQKVENHLHI